MAPKSERPGSLYRASSLVVLFSCLASNLVPGFVLVLSFASSPPTWGEREGEGQLTKISYPPRQRGGGGGLFLFCFVQKCIHDLALF